jgi:hypothetical protein
MRTGQICRLCELSLIGTWIGGWHRRAGNCSIFWPPHPGPLPRSEVVDCGRRHIARERERSLCSTNVTCCMPTFITPGPRPVFEIGGGWHRQAGNCSVFWPPHPGPLPRSEVVDCGRRHIARERERSLCSTNVTCCMPTFHHASATPCLRNRRLTQPAIPAESSEIRQNPRVAPALGPNLERPSFDEVQVVSNSRLSLRAIMER